jgi:hypothetical protein
MPTGPWYNNPDKLAAISLAVGVLAIVIEFGVAWAAYLEYRNKDNEERNKSLQLFVIGAAFVAVAVTVVSLVISQRETKLSATEAKEETDKLRGDISNLQSEKKDLESKLAQTFKKRRFYAAGEHLPIVKFRGRDGVMFNIITTSDPDATDLGKDIYSSLKLLQFDVTLFDKKPDRIWVDGGSIQAQPLPEGVTVETGALSKDAKAFQAAVELVSMLTAQEIAAKHRNQVKTYYIKNTANTVHIFVGPKPSPLLRQASGSL